MVRFQIPRISIFTFGDSRTINRPRSITIAP
jgi:hypothetical protein